MAAARVRSVRQWTAIVLATALASLLIIGTTGGMLSSPQRHGLNDFGKAPVSHATKAHKAG